MSGYSIARYMVQSRCKSFNKLAWSYNLNGWAIFRGLISHDYMYVCKTLPSLCARHTVGGPGIWGHLGIWVSWYLGQSQTDKNTESTATPPNTNTQCWLFCSSKLLQIYQRTNKKERPHSYSSKSKCSLLCEFLFSDLQAMKKKIGPSLFFLST